LDFNGILKFSLVSVSFCFVKLRSARCVET